MFPQCDSEFLCCASLSAGDSFSFPLCVLKKELWITGLLFRVPDRCLKFFYSIRKRVKPLAAAAACEQTDVWVLIETHISFLIFENSLEILVMVALPVFN